MYPWHPWSGLSVQVHELSERGNASALRCSLGRDAGRRLEVPAWMFEREACVPLVVATRPRVGVGALSALQRLLKEVSGRGPTDALASAAAGDSPDQNRGEVHATPPRPPPGNAWEPSSALDDVIAGMLNRNGLTTGNGNRWTRERVTALRSHHGIPVHRRMPEDQAPWLNLNKAAAVLRISPKTLRLEPIPVGRGAT